MSKVNVNIEVAAVNANVKEARERLALAKAKLKLLERQRELKNINHLLLDVEEQIKRLEAGEESADARTDDRAWEAAGEVDPASLEAVRRKKISLANAWHDSAPQATSNGSANGQPY